MKLIRRNEDPSVSLARSRQGKFMLEKQKKTMFDPTRQCIWCGSDLDAVDLWMLTDRPKSWTRALWDRSSPETLPPRVYSGYICMKDRRFRHILRTIIKFKIEYASERGGPKHKAFELKDGDKNVIVIDTVDHLERTLNIINQSMWKTAKELRKKYKGDIDWKPSMKMIVVYDDHSYDATNGIPALMYEYFNLEKPTSPSSVARFLRRA